MTKIVHIDVEDRSRGMNQRIDPTVADKPGDPNVGEHAPERTPEKTSTYVPTALTDRMKNRP